MSSFVTYRKFKNSTEALPFLQKLDENNVQYYVENIAPPVDVTFTGGNQMEDTIAVKISPDQFDKADQIMMLEAQQLKELLPHDYYLYGFTDQELEDILRNFDEWNEMDYIWANKILQERDRHYSDEDLTRMKSEKIAKLRTPEKGDSFWMAMGFLASISGGLLGILMGYHYLKFKKTLPNGERVKAYTEDTRRKGKLMYLLGIAFLIFYLLLILIV